MTRMDTPLPTVSEAAAAIRAYQASPADRVMGEPMPRTFRGDALAHALRTARVDLPAERVEIVRETAEAVYAVLDQLDTLELGETPPATALNARWE